MPRVICDLPNASDEISGVKFHPLEDGGKISDEVSEELAELFASIPGYAIDEEEREPVKPVAQPAPTTRKAAAAKKADKPAAAPAPESTDANPPAAPEGGEEVF